MLFPSKLLPIFVYPLGLALLLGLVALVSGRRLGQIAVALMFIILWGASMPAASNWLVAQLEAKYPPVSVKALPHADVAIVLGGSIGQPLPPRLTPDLSDAADRVLLAARLFRAGKVDWVLVSGGNFPWQPATKPESQLVADLLVEFGVRPDAIVQDDASRNTRENASNSARIMLAKGWHTALLVTSAAHMPRAAATFRETGLDVIPATTDVRVTLPYFSSALDFMPDASALAQTTDAIKEWIGLFVYRLRGWA